MAHDTSRMPEPGSVHVITGAVKTRVVLSGEVDAELGPSLLESAADAADTGLEIEVDVQHVTFMDSTGVSFLARLAAGSDLTVTVLHASDEIRFLLEITGAGEHLRVADDDPGADRALPPSRPDLPDRD